MGSFFRKTTNDDVMAGNVVDRSPSQRESAFEAGEVKQTKEPAPTRNVDSGIRQEPSPDAASAGARVSVIGPSLGFKGTLSADEDLLIHGRIEGSISHQGAQLTIGAHGQIKADITARRIIVQGTVQGDMRATDSVVVEASAQVLGNIAAPRVGIKDGAKFKGDIDMDASGEKLGESAVHEILGHARS